MDEECVIGQAQKTRRDESGLLSLSPQLVGFVMASGGTRAAKKATTLCQSAFPLPKKKKRKVEFPLAP